MSKRKEDGGYSVCPKCNRNKVIVSDSRPSLQLGFHSIRRRRHCLACEHTYSTYEIPAELLDTIECFRESATYLMNAVKILTSANKRYPHRADYSPRPKG
ncbi:MAG: hypothetical protein PHS93_09910, partial [Candidatus Omnitrophica bacterium]|nr:hypothetical protein [Candidatus Omnitrophota bacterium]